MKRLQEYLAKQENDKRFQEICESGAREFGVRWLDANQWAISAAMGIPGVTYYEQPFKTLIARVVLCTLRRSFPKEPEQATALEGIRGVVDGGRSDREP
jgi:hypothetical protein